MRGTEWSEGDWVEQGRLGGARGTGWSKGDWVDEGSHGLETLSVVTKDFCQNKCVSWWSLEDTKDIKRCSNSISASLKEMRLQTAHLHRRVGSFLQELLLHSQPELS